MAGQGRSARRWMRGDPHTGGFMELLVVCVCVCVFVLSKKEIRKTGDR